MRITSKRTFKKVLKQMIDIAPNGMPLDDYDFLCSSEFRFKMRKYKGHYIGYSPLIDKRKIYFMVYLYKD